MATVEPSKITHPVPDLRPPGSHNDLETGTAGRQVLVWVALSVVIVIGLVVLLVLPGLVNDDPSDRAVAPAEQVVAEETRIAGQDAGATTTSREQANQALQDFLQLRARLELENAPIWGEPEWSLALEGASRGNDLFAQQKFAEAADILTGSLEMLRVLASESSQRLEDALSAGWQALEIDDSVSAVERFETAVAIEADSLEAIDGLERARVRPDLLSLMAKAESGLAMNDLYKAQAAYAEAVELDERYQPAQSALREVTGQIIDLEFNQAMSTALRALDAQQPGPAETALTQAGKLKPKEQVVKDAQFRLEQIRRKLLLANQRQASTAREKVEDWSAAADIYRQVLAKEPQAAFARQGLELAQDRERLHQQLDHYLVDPSRLWSAQPLANADKLIVAAGKPPARESRLIEKLQRLKQLLIEAQTPLTINLQSDGLTNVLIYHVGRLGPFTRQHLELLPGSYTVVGSRPGYRDVRQTFTVQPGTGPVSLDIRCEETV